MPGRPNVLVVVLDSVRARNTSVLGYSHRTTPFLEDLGGESTVYQYAYAPSTTSSASHVSFFTGLHENEHRVYHDDGAVDGVETVWERLRDAGYSTGLFTVNPQFRKLDSLRRGFERTVLDPDDSAGLPYPDAVDPVDIDVPDWFPGPRTVYRTAASLGQRAPVRTLANGLSRVRDGTGPASTHLLTAFSDWREGTDGPWAAFLNLMDAHAPYSPADRHNRWADDELRAVQERAGGGHFGALLDELRTGSWWAPSALEHLYDGAVRQGDWMVERLVEGLRDAGAFDETFLAVTSDHGEGFGEPSRVHPSHHVFGHATGIHEVQTHVPLVVSAPGQTDGRRVDGPATLTHLPDAIDAVLDGEFTPESLLGADGRVIVSRGSDRAHRYRLDDGFPADDRTELPDRTYAHYEWDGDHLTKSISSGNSEATVRIYSPQESVKVSDTAALPVLEQFPGTAETGSPTAQTRGELDEATRARLEEFGYL